MTNADISRQLRGVIIAIVLSTVTIGLLCVLALGLRFDQTQSRQDINRWGIKCVIEMHKQPKPADPIASCEEFLRKAG